MKSPPFIYHRPSTLDEALALLAEHGDEAKVLAGGQSLIPLMALRLGRPAHLVDIGSCDELRGVTTSTDGVSLGALVTHAEAERSETLQTEAPLVHEAMPWIAHRAIRTRGTVVGSIAHGDPAAEMPAVVLATGAIMVAASVNGRREIPAPGFFEGYLSTALRADEILVEVRFPTWPAKAVGSIAEVARRHGDYALVGVAARLELAGDTITDVALAYFGAASTAIRVADAEQSLIGQPPTSEAFAAAAAIVSDQLTPPADNHGSQAYRKHLAGVLTRQALDAALAKTARTGAPA